MEIAMIGAEKAALRLAEEAARVVVRICVLEPAGLLAVTHLVEIIVIPDVGVNVRENVRVIAVISARMAVVVIVDIVEEIVQLTAVVNVWKIVE